MSSSHLIHLNQLASRKVEGGERIVAAKSNFPALIGVSFYKLLLKPKAAREPHWHANADELGYCLSGKALVSLYASGNIKESFIINEGDVFFIPSGALHYIENISNDPCHLALQFSNEEPEDFALTSAMCMFSNAVLGNTWNVNENYFSSLSRPDKDPLISLLERQSQITVGEAYSSPYRFSLENSAPLIQNSGGTAKVARQNVWPILDRQAVYSLELTGTGMREPHWHPETAELGYVKEGKGRMSILSPDGNIDTYEMQEGDLYFIPKAYPHHIENLLDSRLKIVIFFDQPMPGDVGFTASIKSFSNGVLGAIFKTSPEFFSKLPTYYEDLFIVDKINSLD